MIHNRAIEARWCSRMGHRWGDLIGLERVGGRLHFSRSCARCGKLENHVSQPSVAGTERRPVGW